MMYFPIELLDVKCHPTRSKDLDAALDLRSKETFTLEPGQSTKKLVGMGFRIRDMPMGMAAFILPRSGLGNSGLILCNSIGLIDPNYRGEIKGKFCWDPDMGLEKPITVERGDRIAQMVIMPYIPVDAIVTDNTFERESDRGYGGFGSSGKS